MPRHLTAVSTICSIAGRWRYSDACGIVCAGGYPGRSEHGARAPDLRMISMSWKSLAAPLMVIAAGVTIIILILSAPDRRSNTGADNRGVAAQEEEPCSAYPANGKTVPDRCLTPEP